MPDATCSADDCGKDATTRGMCGAHYAKWHRARGGPKVTKNSACTVEGCGGTDYVRRQLCSKHYERWRAHGDPLWEPHAPATSCAVADCTNPGPFVKGWCGIHYQNWRRHGDPAWAKPVAPDLPGETWRPVVGFDGLYEVSDLGRVRSLPRFRVPGGILAQHPAGKGYMYVGLFPPGADRAVGRSVHRLVARAFIGPCPRGQEVRHGPNGKLDNRASQLCYGTKSQNLGEDKRRDGTAEWPTCKFGHEWTEETTVLIWRAGLDRPVRRCGTCLLRYEAEKNAKNRAKRAAARAARSVAA